MDTMTGAQWYVPLIKPNFNDWVIVAMWSYPDTPERVFKECHGRLKTTWSVWYRGAQLLQKGSVELSSYQRAPLSSAPTKELHTS
jgi:hypothetical protein